MSHTIHGLIGPIDELQRLTTGLKSAKIARLDVDGYGFLPFAYDLSHDVGMGLSGLGKKAEKPIIYIETDYFGGAGGQSACYWKNGQKIFESTKSGSINAALKMLGIKAIEDHDEFDTIGLGKFRTNESWALKADDEDDDDLERLDCLRILDELRDNP